jgi:hypothetical protein
MFEASLAMPKGQIVSVTTTNNRGLTPEELAERCAERIISVSKDAHPALRDQAIAFRAQIVVVLSKYLKEAVTNDRVTVYNALVESGQQKLAEAILKL